MAEVNVWHERYCGICGEVTPHESNRCVECARRQPSELLADPRAEGFNCRHSFVPVKSQYNPGAGLGFDTGFDPVRGRMVRRRPEPETFTMVMVLGNQRAAFEYLRRKHQP